MRRRKLIILLPLLLALGAVGAYAWFSAIGSGTGQASVGSLGAPTGVTGSASGSIVHVSWTAPSGGAVAPSGYYVTRNDGTSDAAACGSSAGSPLPASPTSCDDSSVASGTYTYTVTAVYRTWTATSAASSAVTVSAAATKLVFTTGAQTLTAGVVSGTITVQRQNASGTPTTGGMTTVDLTTSSTAGVFRNSGDTGTITAVTIADGTSSASFKYTDTKAGTPTITAADHAGTLTSASQQETVNPAAASQLSFTQSPGSTSADSALSPQPKVTVQDQFGNTILGDSSTVTLSITSGTPTSGGPGSLTGCTQTEASGVVSFSGCAIRTTGTGYKLHATDGSLAAADSSAFSITAGAADATQSTLTPTSASITANGTATQVLTVTAKDAFGNNETSGGATVTITRQSGTGTVGLIADNGNGTYTATVTAPTATGSGVFVATLGGSPVKSGTATQTTSTITYVPGPADATQSTLTPTSASITANGTATQTLTVTAKDAFGNSETSGGATVTITRQSGTGTISSVTDNGNGTYTATVTAPTATGSGVFVATLNGSPVKNGSGSQTTSTISYVPGAADATRSTLTPTSASITANGTATQVLTVTAKDAFGNNETSGGATVTITRQSGTGTISAVTDNHNGTYTATVTAPTATGSGVFVATLNGGQVKSGSGSQTASTITYLPGPADATQSTLTPTSASITANGTATQVLTVTAKDAFGNLETTGGATVTITRQSGSGTIGSVSDNGNGAYTATVTAPTAPGSGVFVATLGGGQVKGGGASQTQSTISYVAGAVSQLVFTTQPAGASGGSAFTTQPVVTAKDATGNTVTSYAGTVTLAIKSGTGTSGATLSGCTGSLSNGATTFSGCTIDKAGSGYVLTAADGTRSVDSNAFAVNVGIAAKLVFTTQPSASSQSSTAFASQPAVTVQDAGGNTVTSDTGSVTLSITSGTGTAGAALNCTSNPATAVSGVATFAGCKVDLAGTGYTLTAARAGLTSGTSSAFAITPGPATQLVFTQQPSNSNPNIAFPTQPILTVEDAAGNTVTTDARAVTLSISKNSPSGTLTCTSNPVNASAGVATFAGCKINNVGTGYTLDAQIGGSGNGTKLTATSAAFNIVALAITFTSCNTGAGHTNTATGTTNDNTGTVSIKIFLGTGTGGTLITTLTDTAPFNGSSSPWTWSASTGNNQLSGGTTYTAQANQVDGASATSTSPTCTFTAN
jgi:hypothetical protein